MPDFDEGNDDIINIPKMQMGPTGKSIVIEKEGNLLRVRREDETKWLEYNLEGMPGKDATIEQIQAVIDSNPELRGKDGHTPTADEIRASIKSIISETPDDFKGEDGKTPTNDEITTLVKNVIAGNPDSFKGPKGDNATNEQVSTSVQSYMTANAAMFKGAKGDPGKDATDAQVSTAASTFLSNNVSLFKGAPGDKGNPGDSHVKVRRKVTIPAQSLQAKYTAPAINLGANVFTNSPVVSVDIESSATNVVLTVQFTVGGSATTGFTVTPTIAAMNTTVSILILGSVNLLGSIPACTLHITASEPI